MAFVFFLLVNAVLFLRPAELVPGWQGVPLYECAIVACLIGALPEILRQLGQPLESQPITLCVVGLLAAVLLAQLPALDVAEAGRTGFHFLKVLVYYVLFV